MQIILPQSELEQAITEYVHGIMNIKDGNTMTIDLKAGRGLDGFTATVDIVKTGTVMPAKTVVPAAVIPVTTPAPIKLPARTTKEEASVTEEKTVDVGATPVADKSEQQEVAAEIETEVAETTPVVRRPLFGSLKKPE
jgi:hypothetical protein